MLARLSHPLAAVWLLGLTQIIGYGTLYYCFPILATDIAREFGWDVSSVYGAFSAALLVGGALAPLIGRQIDRFGALPLMTWGSVASAFALLLVASSTPALFFPAFAVLEISASLVLYDAAFAALAQRTGRQAQTRIAQMTLIAGFASSISWPVTQWLHDILSWREVLTVFALLNLGACVPLHLALLRAGVLADSEADAESLIPIQPEAPRHLARPLLILVSLGFAFSGVVVSGMLTMMVPTLSALGLGSLAVPIAALFGPAQVLSRLVNMGVGKRMHPLTGSLISAGLLGGAPLLLAGLGPLPAVAAIFAVMFGLGSGVNSIVRGTLPLVLFGAEIYGSVLGKMALARLLLNAGAPFAFAWMLEHLSATAALTATGLAGTGAIACFLIMRHFLKMAQGSSASSESTMPSSSASSD